MLMRQLVEKCTCTEKGLGNGRDTYLKIYMRCKPHRGDTKNINKLNITVMCSV